MIPELPDAVPTGAASGLTPGRLLRLATQCPTCGARPEMRVTEAMSAALATLDPWMLVGTYACQTSGCGAVYKIIVGAYTAAFETEEHSRESDPVSGEARPERSNGEIRQSDGALSLLEDLAGSIEAPVDWSAEHDHYLHGVPKRAGNAA